MYLQVLDLLGFFFQLSLNHSQCPHLSPPKIDRGLWSGQSWPVPAQIMGDRGLRVWVSVISMSVRRCLNCTSPRDRRWETRGALTAIGCPKAAKYAPCLFRIQEKGREEGG